MGALGSVLLAERISRPLETLVEGTIRVAAGEKLGISVHDHVVIGKSGETSFKTTGLL